MEVSGDILSFSNRNALENTVNEIRELKLRAQVERLSAFYSEGFMSLRPILDPENEFELNRVSEVLTRNSVYASTARARGARLSAADLDSALNEEYNRWEGIIGDDVLASLLNANGEILVGDSLYRFTEFSLLFVHASERDHLDDFLSNNFDLPFVEDGQEALISLDEKVSFYRGTASNDLEEYEIEEEILEFEENDPLAARILDSGDSYMNSPSPCRTQNRTFIAFGKSRICYKNFNRRYRIRTKYWDQNFWFLKTTGISVARQRKKVFWFKSRATELRLKYEVYGTYTYNFKYPDFYGRSKFFTLYQGKIYDDQMRLYRSQSDGIPIPDGSFASEALIIYKPLIGSYSGKKLNKEFYTTTGKELQKLFKKLGTREPKSFGLQMVDGKKIHYHKIEYKTKSSAKEISRKFSIQFGISVKLKNNNSGSLKPDWKATRPQNFVESFKLKYLEVAGVGRRSNTWKGSKFSYGKK